MRESRGQADLKVNEHSMKNGKLSKTTPESWILNLWRVGKHAKKSDVSTFPEGGFVGRGAVRTEPLHGRSVPRNERSALCTARTRHRWIHRQQFGPGVVPTGKHIAALKLQRH